MGSTADEMKQRNNQSAQRQAMELTQSEQQKEKRMQNGEDSLKDLWDNIKCIDYHIIEVSEKNKKGKKTYLKK